MSKITVEEYTAEHTSYFGAEQRNPKARRTLKQLHRSLTTSLARGGYLTLACELMGFINLEGDTLHYGAHLLLGIQGYADSSVLGDGENGLLSDYLSHRQMQLSGQLR